MVQITAEDGMRFGVGYSYARAGATSLFTIILISIYCVIVLGVVGLIIMLVNR